MNTNDPDQNDGLDVSTLNRRKVLKGVSAAGAVGVLGSGTATARHQTRGPQEECGCIDDAKAWGKYDFQCVEEECVEYDEDEECLEYECVEWDFVLTEGDDRVNITGWEVKDDDPSEPITVYYEPADGYTVSQVCAFGGADNHEDDEPDDETYESDLENRGGQQAAISNLTFCVEEELPPGELPGWQVDLIHGEPIEDFSEGTYNDGNRLLQALWADPEDPTGRLEDQHFDQNDDAYADCHAEIVQDITFDPDTGMATATLDPGDCKCEDFDLVSYDAPGFEWEGGEDQVLYGSARGQTAPVAGSLDDVDGNCVFTVEVPHGSGD